MQDRVVNVITEEMSVLWEHAAGGPEGKDSCWASWEKGMRGKGRKVSRSRPRGNSGWTTTQQSEGTASTKMCGAWRDLGSS